MENSIPRKSLKQWMTFGMIFFLLCNVLFVTGLGKSNVAYALDPNIAIGKTASSDTGSSTTASGNDDSIYTQWRADDGSNNHWYKVDLGAPYNLTGSEVMFESNYLIKYKVEVSSDNSTWSTVVNKLNNTSSAQTQNDPFSSTGKRYVKITLTEVPSGVWASINEFRVFGITGTSTPTPTPAPTATPTPTPASGWTYCADEHQQCAFTGTKTVRYGSGSTYYTGTYTNGVYCDNSIFGDPIVGVFKHCDVSSTSPTPTPTPAPPSGNSFYVDPTNGNDANSGTLTSPFRTIDKARQVVRSVKGSMTSNINVYLRGGTYALNSTLVFDALDSGTNGFNVIYQAYNGEIPVISGGQTITGWTLTSNGIYKASAQGLNFRQLYVADSRAVRARYPNTDTYSRLKSWDDSAKKIVVNNSDIPSYTNDAGNPAEISIQLRWTNDWLRIGSVERLGADANLVPAEPERTTIFNKNDPPRWANQPYHLENALEFLDQPGEWYLKKSTNEVYYKPRAGENISSIKVVAPKVDTLIKLAGTPSNPVHHLQFSGISFESTNWTKPSDYGFVDHQGNQYLTYFTSYGDYNAPRTEAALILNAATNIQVTGNKFKNIGSIAIDIYNGSQNNSIIGNRITDIAGSGIQLGYFPPSHTEQTYNPPANQQTLNNTISNNYIARIGLDYKGAVGIITGYTYGAVIEHNEITNAPYSGISVGWGWSFEQSMLGNNQIKFNHIWNVVNALQTEGGFTLYLNKLEL